MYSGVGIGIVGAGLIGLATGVLDVAPRAAWLLLGACSDAGELANAIIEDFGPALGLSGLNALGAQLFTDEFGELSGSVSADTGGMTGRVTLTFD